MKLKNETRYRDDDLRVFLLAGLRAMGSTGKGKVITVAYTRPGSSRSDEDKSYATGWARMGRWRVVGKTEHGLDRTELIEACHATVRLPPPGVPVDMRCAARVWEHEILHLRGVDHRDMSRAQMDCSGPLPEWAAELEIRLAEEEPRPPREERLAVIVAQREQHARTMLEKWETKATRAAKVAKKWREKVRGYERRAAAKRAPEK